MLGEIRKTALDKNKGCIVRLIFTNGFQMRGRLLNYDECDMVIETSTYGSEPVIVSHSAITTLIPSKTH